jgi:hypothetical protein
VYKKFSETQLKLMQALAKYQNPNSNNSKTTSRNTTRHHHKLSIGSNRNLPCDNQTPRVKDATLLSPTSSNPTN